MIRAAARAIVLVAIAAYRRFVSPYKGFTCAYEAHTGRASCSALGRRAVRRKDRKKEKDERLPPKRASDVSKEET